MVGAPTNVRWPDTHTEALRSAMIAGCSFSQAAIRLNELFGTAYSRNAAIGKAGRLGISFAPKDKPKTKPKSYKPRARIAKPRAFETIEPEQVELRCAEIEPRNVSLSDLGPDECRYAYGDGPFLFCGHPKLDDTSYCGPHYDLTRNKPRTNSEAVTEARRKRIRSLNFRRALLEGKE